MLTRATAGRRPFGMNLLTDQVRAQRALAEFGVVPGDKDWQAAFARRSVDDGPPR